MNAEELRAAQSPLKARYKEDPSQAHHILKAVGHLDTANQTCTVHAEHGPRIVAGLHAAAGGSGQAACSGDMLLQSLVACAGVTLGAVSTALGIPVQGGTVTVEGDLDFRGTLGVDKATPIGFTAIRLTFDLVTDASEEQLANLLRLTERYCVIYQTLKVSPAISAVARRSTTDASA